MGLMQIKKRNGKLQAFRAVDISTMAQLGDKTVICVKGDPDEMTIDADYNEVLTLWKMALNETTVWGAP